MPFLKVRQCKICSSHIRDKIDSMLDAGVPYSKILAFAKKNNLQIAIASISRHRKMHKSITTDDIKKANATQRAKKKYDKSIDEIIEANIVLETIISRGYHAIMKGNLKPNMIETLKAIELQDKLKTEQPFLRAYGELLQEIALGNSRKAGIAGKA